MVNTERRVGMQNNKDTVSTSTKTFYRENICDMLSNDSAAQEEV